MDDALLIQQVQQFVFLYERKHPDFENEMKRENAWTRIGVILEQLAETCEQHWVVLRNTYNAIRRDLKNSPSGCSGEVTKVKWPLFGYLNFLEPFIVSRETSTSYISSQSSGSLECNNVWDKMELIAPSVGSEVSKTSTMDSQDIAVEVVSEDVTTEAEGSSNSEGASPAPSSCICQEPSTSTSTFYVTPTGSTKRSAGGSRRSSKISKNGYGQVADQITKTLEQFGKYLQGKAATTTQVDDEDAIFGKKIASEIKKIHNVQDKMKIKRDIYDIFYNYFKNKN